MMYIVSYSSVQNGLVYSKYLYIYMYVLWCTPDRDFNKLINIISLFEPIYFAVA